MQEHTEHNENRSPTFPEKEPYPGRRSPELTHAGRIRNSLANVFTPRQIHSRFEEQMGNRRRRHAIWHPMSALVARMRSRETMAEIPEHHPIERSASIDLCGRFKIGHPLSCNANIADDPLENDKAQFIPNSGGNGSLYRQVSRRLAASQSETLYSDSQTFQFTGRPTAVFLESDLLRCSFPEDTPVIIRINVSGMKFFVLNSTLQRDPFVYSKFLEDAVWLPDEREYFFERDPNVFRFVHNYLRRGEVHLPCGMCGPLLEKELDDWGLPLGLDVQRCCLGPMMESKFKLESLQKFERKLEPKYIEPTNWISWCMMASYNTNHRVIRYLTGQRWPFFDDPELLTQGLALILMYEGA